MFMSSTVEASVFMGKNYSDNLHSIKNTWENLTLKMMFEISETSCPATKNGKLPRWVTVDWRL